MRGNKWSTAKVLNDLLHVSVINILSFIFAPCTDISLPFASLQLLAPPVRLMSAALWKVMKQRDVMEYGVVEEFVTSACESIPGLLTLRHQGKLALGLRARVSLLEKWFLLLIVSGCIPSFIHTASLISLHLLLSWYWSCAANSQMKRWLCHTWKGSVLHLPLLITQW